MPLTLSACLWVCASLAAPARACDTALVLALDASGSMDAGEYAEQTAGLALALSDPVVVDTLVRGQVALAIVQWSGSGQQALLLGWQRMRDEASVAAFARGAQGLRRIVLPSDTAVGEAVDFSAAQFADVPDCTRHVIDISGDGPENAGFTASRARSAAEAAGITINAIAIEDMGQSAPVAAFYERWVITRRGFVIAARGVQDYPRAIRAKLLRELETPVG